MLKKRKLLTAVFICGLLVAGGAMVFRFLDSLAIISDPEYGVAVPAREVDCIELPRGVEFASYWSNRHESHVDFKITKEALLRMFSDIKFEEVSPLHYSVLAKVTNPNQPEFEDRSADSGLEYKKVWDNGGGIRVTFDRSTGIAT
jgi:hypothetical protein